MEFSLKKYYRENTIEAGCDEAGRGCLAGPVYAAAVILPPDFYHPLLNDSKKLTAKQRETLRLVIEKEAVAHAHASVDHTLIDKINILNASLLSMHIAVGQLETRPQLLLIDGNRFKKYENIPHRCIVKGDSLYASIAAASVLAKTYRDDYMRSIHKEFPQYGWDRNMGYPTEVHRKAVAKYGLSPYHRKTFRSNSDQLFIDFGQV